MSEQASEQSTIESTTPESGSTETIAPEAEAIQGISPISMEDLTGIPDQAEQEAAAVDEGKQEESSTESKQSASSESKEEPETQSAEEPEAKEEKASEKPPKGFVPLPALKEVRAENKYLKEQLDAMQEQIENLKTQKPVAQQEEVKKPADAFKELSPEAFEELAAEDPVEAMLYLNKLNAHRDSQRELQVRQAAEQQAQLDARQQVDAAYARMVKAVPGLLDEGSAAANDLATFAESIGFGEQMTALLDPGTVILSPGQNEPVLLGESAAVLVEMLAGLKDRLSGADQTSASARAELEKSIRAEVQKELLEKFKSTGESAFTSMASVAGTGGEAVASYAGKMLSAAEFGKLSPAEQERYLSGA